MIDIDPIEEADKARIGSEAEASVAEADQQRLIARRRESELKHIAADLPEDEASLWMYAEHSLAQSAISMIDAGRALIKLKETLPHGDFQAGIKERGISPRTARKIMASARRFADRSEKFLKLGRSKLYACMDLDDDDLDALEDGKSILDVDLDKMDRMTTAELRAAIQKREADLAIKDQLLESKNKQIDAVAEENEQLKGTITTPEDAPQVRNIRTHGDEAEAKMILLRGMAHQLSVEAAAANPHEVAALTGVLDRIRTELALAYRLLEEADPAYQACDELAGKEDWQPDMIDGAAN